VPKEMKLLAINQHGANHIRTGIYFRENAVHVSPLGYASDVKNSFWWFFLTEKNNRTPIGDGPFPSFEKTKESILGVLNSWERIL
jgi:hypothetical protein